MTIITDDCALYILHANVNFKKETVLTVKIVYNFSFPMATLMHGTVYEMNKFDDSINGNRG